MNDYVNESIEVSEDMNFGESYDKEWALREEAKRDRNIEIAKNLISKGMDIGDISEVTGLTIEEIQKL